MEQIRQKWNQNHWSERHLEKNQNQKESTESVKIYSVRDTENTLRRQHTYSQTKRKREKANGQSQYSVQFSSVQSLSCVRLFATPWVTARQASLSTTISRSSFRPMSIESVMPSSHPILGRPLLLLPPIPPSIRVFSSESALRMRWPKYLLELQL